MHVSFSSYVMFSLTNLSPLSSCQPSLTLSLTLSLAMHVSSSSYTMTSDKSVSPFFLPTLSYSVSSHTPSSSSNHFQSSSSSCLVPFTRPTFILLSPASHPSLPSLPPPPPSFYQPSLFAHTPSLPLSATLSYAISPLNSPRGNLLRECL
jgi:hypothetical protein